MGEWQSGVQDVRCPKSHASLSFPRFPLNIIGAVFAAPSATACTPGLSVRRVGRVWTTCCHTHTRSRSHSSSAAAADPATRDWSDSLESFPLRSHLQGPLALASEPVKRGAEVERRPFGVVACKNEADGCGPIPFCHLVPDLIGQCARYIRLTFGHRSSLWWRRTSHKTQQWCHACGTGCKLLQPVEWPPGTVYTRRRFQGVRHG